MYVFNMLFHFTPLSGSGTDGLWLNIKKEYVRLVWGLNYRLMLGKVSEDSVCVSR